MTRIIAEIDLAIKALKEGDLVAIPTETVYGLAADATNTIAVNSIFTTKSRPKDHPLIMHVGLDWDISQWVSHVPDYAKQLMQLFWPGPLTLIFPKKPNTAVSPSVTGGQDTIAIRCPNHPLTLKLLDKLGKPIVAPSANPFGRVSPTTARHVLQDFPNHDFYILDGGRAQVGLESTIIDATHPDHFQILREGVINKTHLVQMQERFVQTQKNSSIKAPGHMKKHYQPGKPALIIDDITTMDELKQQYPNFYLLHFTPIKVEQNQLTFQFSPSLEQAAFEFYYQLRYADESKAEAIFIELPPNTFEWKALRDRIIKACS